MGLLVGTKEKTQYEEALSFGPLELHECKFRGSVKTYIKGKVFPLQARCGPEGG